MPARPHLPWSELRKLDSLRSTAQLVSRRWGLGLGYASRDEARAPRPPRPEPKGTVLLVPAKAFAPVCNLVRDRELGERRCDEASSEILRLVRLAWDAEREHAGKRAVVRRATCHAGLVEVGVAVIAEGDLAGVLIAGGFLAVAAAGTAGDELGLARERMDARVAPLSLPTLYDKARSRVAVLDAKEASFLEELLVQAALDLGRAIEKDATERPATSELARDYATRYAYDSIIGKSGPMQELYSVLDKVVSSEATVLIQGENGTGKELVARAIHHNSPRKHRRFVVTNCSAFNDNLLDSELFGHVRGAFTGAIGDKPGLFQIADNGTFFLDEIGDMSPTLQVKVLRVIQEGTFMPVGGTETVEVDVRIIAATNRDLKAMVDNGTFREDLYYRINVINLVIPPLRERPDDLLLLAETFLSKHVKGHRQKAKVLSPDCQALFRSYAWPGNVRELQNEIERLVVLAGDERVIAETLLSPRIRSTTRRIDAEDGARATSLPTALESLERGMLLEALKRHQWNKTRAAAELEISRRNLIRLAQKYKLDDERPRKPNGR